MEFINILIIVSAVTLVLLLWIIVGVRHLRGTRRDIKEYWEVVDEKLRKRHNLIPNLIETVREHSGEQEELLAKLIEERMRAAREYNPGPKKIEYELDLTNRINNVVDLGRLYKELSKDTNFLELRREIDELEKGVESESKKYNEKVRRYNSSRRFFLLLPLAAIFRFKSENIFEIEQ